jgi:hypothetical protein
VRITLNTFGTKQNAAVLQRVVEPSWNVMAHVQKPDFFFRRNGRVHLNRRGRQFSRLLAAEVCASAVVMLGTPCSEVGWRVLVTHSIRQFPLHFPSRAPPCAITFQLESTYGVASFWRQWQLITMTARNINYELKKTDFLLNFILFGSTI